jgi:aminoglycoside phosphotransferase (APT) family kinase protein
MGRCKQRPYDCPTISSISISAPPPEVTDQEGAALETLEFVDVPMGTLRAIAERHGLRVETFARMPQVGVINAIYALGDGYVLRVPRNDPGTVAQARTEAIAAPAARAAGVRTPRLVAFEEVGDLLPVPYLIYERVQGRTLGLLDWEPAAIADVWREMGRDLALLHSLVPDDGLVDQLRVELVELDARELAEDRAADGWFTALEVRWLIRWLDRLAEAAAVPVPARMIHLDVQATNVMVDTDALEYRALLDWGCAGLGDAAFDFFGHPLRAVPFVLEGHRSVMPLDGDESAEARILWRHLWFALRMLPRGAAPGMSWGERPLAWLLAVLRFFQETDDPRWREWRP